MRLFNSNWLVVALFLTVVNGRSLGEAFSEELHIRKVDFGYGEKIIGTFNFTTFWDLKDKSNFENDEIKSFNLFPKALTRIVEKCNLDEFLLTFSNTDASFPGTEVATLPSGAGLIFRLGSMDSTEESIDRYLAHTLESLSGMFGISLALTSSLTEIKKDTFVAQYVEEPFCTENLRPALALLPCKQSYGLASLISGPTFFGTRQHSLSVQFKKQCKNEECSIKRLILNVQFNLEIESVDDLLTQFEQKLKIEEILSCPLASRSTLSFSSKATIYDMKTLDLEVLKTNVGKEINNLSLHLGDSRPTIRKLASHTPGLDEQITVEFRNTKNESVSASVTEAFPHFVTLKASTIQLLINGTPDDSLVFKSLEKLSQSEEGNIVYLGKTKDFGKKEVTLILSLKMEPNAEYKLIYHVSKKILHVDEYPSDASRGLDLPSAMLEYSNSNEAAKRVFSNAILIRLPFPDFSMPFNVITLSSTLIAFFAGSLVNIFSKELKENPDEKSTIQKIKIKMKSLFSAREKQKVE